MDDERSWQRITEIVRGVANENARDVPPALERVTGDAWQRDTQRRAALDTIANLVEDFPRFATEVPAEQIADELDTYWLESHLPESEPDE